MEILTLSQAKPKMGRLIDRALHGEAVVIRKGSRLVQLTEYVVPEPIPDRPVVHVISAARLGGLLESMELLADDKFKKQLKRLRAGKVKFQPATTLAD